MPGERLCATGFPMTAHEICLIDESEAGVITVLVVQPLERRRQNAKCA